jgi:large subunit ribosomal protein L33
MAKSSKKTLIRLVSTEGSGTFYVARTKGKTNLMLRKYDKKLRRHVMFKEAKMK